MPASAPQRLCKGLAALAAALLPLAALLAGLLPTAAQGQAKPMVNSIDLVADRFSTNPPAEGPYGRGQEIWIAVTFSEDINFRDLAPNAAEPGLSLMIGDQTREASFDHLSNNDQLRFRYDVIAGDAGRIRVGANALRDNGNTIYRRSGDSDTAGDHADLSHAPMDLGQRAAAPTRVTNLKVEPGCDGELVVTWTAATYAPSGYRIHYRNQATRIQKRWNPSNSGLERGDTTRAVITGLENGQEYTIRVDTQGDAAGTALYKGGAPRATAQTRVTDLAVEPGDGQLTITWTAATCAPNGYRIHYRNRATGIQKRWNPSNSGLDRGDTTRAVITGLTDGQEYTIRVDTQGDVDGTASYKGGAPANQAPRITEIANQTATFGTNLLVDVDATDPGMDTLQYSAASGNANVATASPAARTGLIDSSQVTVTPVGEGTATITVTVSDGALDATETFDVTVSKAMLGKPSVTVTARNAKLTATWADVPNAGSYEVQYKESDKTAWLDSSDDTSPAEITGLTNGEEYDVRVRAKAASNSKTHSDGDWSDIRKGAPLDRPTVVGFKLIAGKDDGSDYSGGPYDDGDMIWVEVRFSKDINFRDRDGGNSPKITLLIGNQEREATWIRFGSFTKEGRFSYTVVAQDVGPIRVKANSLNDNGNTIYRRNGNVDAPVDQVLLAHNEVDLGQRVKIRPVQGLRVEAGDGSLTASWTAATDAPGGYLVRWRVQERGSSLSTGVKRSGTSYTIPDLTKGTTYVVRVDKLDANGNVLRGGQSSVAGTPIGLEFSTPTLTVPEGGSAAYTVKLATQPTGSVTVTVGGATGDVSVSPTSLTFTMDNWNTAQMVTVSAGQDSDMEDDTAMLSHTASGGDYNSVSGSLSVTVTDNRVTELVAPTGLEMMTKIVNGFTVSWTAVPGATGYKAYAGGSPAYQVTGTTAVFLFLNPDFTHTVSVIATANGLPDSPAAVLENQQPGRPPQGSEIEAIWINDAPRDRTGVFQLGEKIQIAIDFKSPVTLDTTGGKPSIGLKIGQTVRQVNLHKAPSFDNGVYANYWVKAEDMDTDGISIAANAIKLNGGKITRASDSTMNVDIMHPAVPDDPYRMVNGGTNTNPNAPGVPGLAGSVDDASPNTRRVYISRGTPAELAVSATDADGDALFYWASLPIRNTDVLTVTPRLPTKTPLVSDSKVRVNPQKTGTAIFTVTVEDDGTPRKYSISHFKIFVAGLSYSRPNQWFVNTQIKNIVPTPVHFEADTSSIGYAVTDGTLPAGLELDAETGVISGTPTQRTHRSGEITVTATGTKEGRTQTATKSLVLPIIRRASNASPPQVTTPTQASHLQVISADGELWLAWKPADYAPNGYSVRWREKGTGTKLTKINEVDGTFYDITDLENGKTYVVRVDTRNAANDGVQEDTRVTATGTPSATLSVVDAEGAEGAVLKFSVALSSSSTREVRVNWHTEPGTAQAGEDYESGSGELVFAPDEVTKTVQVRTLDDAHDDPGETFKVLLSDAQGAVIDDGEAVGTIRNDDPMPSGWLARFGRAAAEQALDGIARRIAAPRTAGREGTLAGYSVGGAALDGEFGDLPDGPSAFGDGMTSGGFNSGLGGFNGGPGAGFGNGMGGMDGSPPYAGHSMTFGEMLAASSFALVSKVDGAGRSAALWGRGARSSFQGMDGAARVDGTLTSALLGADYGGGRWLAGLALSRTVGEGGYRQPGAGGGRIRATLGTAVPYVSLNASARLSLWAAAGGGAGALTLTPDGAAPTKADIDWRMAALGLRGDLLASGSGAALAFVSDALWTRTDSDRAAAQGAATSLAASSSATSRLRLGLEGSWALPLGLTPQLEVGVRRDTGDAGTGVGVELGGGLIWNAPRFGLNLDISGRTLLASGIGGNRGFSAALNYDPSPANPRGLSLTLRQDLGGAATGGLAALFASDLPGDGFGGGARRRWSAEAAYGLPAFGGRFAASPTLSYGAFGGGRDYSLGWRLEPAADAEYAPDLSLGLRAIRREAVDASADHGVEVNARARW